jgi:hypothetical protein
MKIRLIVFDIVDVRREICVFFINFFEFGVKECILMELIYYWFGCFFSPNQRFASLLHLGLCIFCWFGNERAILCKRFVLFQGLFLLERSKFLL